jgi:hypothetical protein
MDCRSSINLLIAQVLLWLASYMGWLKSLHITIDCADVKKAKTKTGSFAAAIKL